MPRMNVLDAVERGLLQSSEAILLAECFPPAGGFDSQN
jgi:hypothetical protein